MLKLRCCLSKHCEELLHELRFRKLLHKGSQCQQEYNDWFWRCGWHRMRDSTYLSCNRMLLPVFFQPGPLFSVQVLSAADLGGQSCVLVQDPPSFFGRSEFRCFARAFYDLHAFRTYPELHWVCRSTRKTERKKAETPARILGQICGRSSLRGLTANPKTRLWLRAK